MISIPIFLTKIAKTIQQKGGRAILVGGYIRDSFLGISSKDLDIEVFGIPSYEFLLKILAQFGKANHIGKSFGTVQLKIEDCELSFSLPRKDYKIDKGHKGFEVHCDSELSFEEAVSRRDFTINAMGVDILSEEFHDPFNGKRDLRDKILRHIGPAFSEDPLRVFRAMQFAGRFSLTINPKTIKLSKSIPLNELPKERIFEEFKKLLLKARNPSFGLKYIPDLNIYSVLPELNKILFIPQDPKWHPEGDVWVHTLMSVDKMAEMRTGDTKKDLILMLAALCHDFGKAETTKHQDGRWRSHGHEKTGKELVLSFLKRLTDDKKIIDQVLALVLDHMKPALLYKDHLKQKVTNAAIRRLSLKVPLKELVLVAKADHLGRTSPDALSGEFPAGEWLLERAAVLNVKAAKPKPYLKGEHLLNLGIKPGSSIGKLINQSFQLQLDGKVNNLNEAIEWAKKQIKY